MKNKTKTFIGLMIFIVLAFSTSVIVYNYTINTLESNMNETISSFKEEQFNDVWAYLEDLQKQSNYIVTNISNSIESDIMELSDDELKLIRKDMNEGAYNDTLHNIFMENISGKNLNDINNHRNGIVIMTSKGYIEDFNYKRASSIDGKNAFRPWDDGIKNSYNKKLEKNAIDKLLDRSSGIIAFESYDMINDDNHIKIDELTYDSLLNVYLKEGIKGLRNYQIFVPYYITDIGDVFGVPDTIQGIKVNNNKIIIAQEFNLYDQIMNSSHKNIVKDDVVQRIINRYGRVLDYLHLFGITLILSICGLIFYFCHVYNYIVSTECKCNKCKAPNDKEIQAKE